MYAVSSSTVLPPPVQHLHQPVLQLPRHRRRAPAPPPSGTPAPPSYSSRPIPAYCAPCPGNRKATRGARRDKGVRPRTTRGDAAPVSHCPSSSRASALLVVTMASRSSSCARPVLAVKQTSANPSPWASRAWYRWARSRRAGSVFAESVSACAARSGAGTVADVVGAASTSTCALVPLKPNELTPARRRPAGHALRAVTTATGSVAHAMCGLGLRRCRCGGISSCWSESTTLIRPATPAAASRWPMLVLTDPMRSGRMRGAPVNAAARARTSIGSPSEVPVPCASTYATSWAATPALASASRITVSCAGPLGAVSPALRPSWFTALPGITARMRSPSAWASVKRFSTTMPQPSPRSSRRRRRRTSCSGRRAPACAPWTARWRSRAPARG